MILKKFGPQGSICPHPGAIYMYITKYSKIFFSETAWPIKAKFYMGAIYMYITKYSKIFFSETAWPIKAKFYMKNLQEEGTNVFINNLGHMTKMAAMPIFGKNPSKISGTV